MPTAISFVVPMAIALCLYAAYVKLSALLLRYSVRWTASFVFAAIIWVVAVLSRLLDVGQPGPIQIGHAVVVLAAALLLGAWFFSTRGVDENGHAVGFKRAFGLSGLTFGLMLATGVLLVLLSRFLFHLRTSAP